MTAMCDHFELDRYDPCFCPSCKHAGHLQRTSSQEVLLRIVNEGWMWLEG
jgi:hypothetical protein